MARNVDARQKINQRRKQQSSRNGGLNNNNKSKKVQGGKVVRNLNARVKSGNRIGKTSAQGASKTVAVERKGRSIQVTRQVKDLRQLIGKPSSGQKQSAIKKRLGLQSRAARDTKKGFRSDNLVSRGPASDSPRITISNPLSGRGNTGARRIAQRAFTSSDEAGQHPLSRNRVWRRADLAPQVVLPPVNPIIIAPFGGGNSNNSGNTIVISNLHPSVTQRDLLELFGEIGMVTSYQHINENTAMVSYDNQLSAQKAVKAYHNRTLDDQPMQVTLIPTGPSTSGSGYRTTR